MPKLAIANTAASTTRMAVRRPKATATPIQTPAWSLEVIFSVTSAFASRISFCTRSERSPRRSPRAWMRSELPKRSRAMELTRAMPGLLVARIGRANGIRLEDPEEKESGDRGQAEDKGGLPAGEIRSVAQQLVDGFATNPLREFLNLVGGAANQFGQLRRFVAQVVSGTFHGVGYMPCKIGAPHHTRIQKTLCL